LQFPASLTSAVSTAQAAPAARASAEYMAAVTAAPISTTKFTYARTACPPSSARHHNTERCIDAQRFICHPQRPQVWNHQSAMSARPFRIGRSRTGLGLFATRPIKKKSRIAEYKGPLLSLKKADKAERSGNRYLYEVNSRWTIDGSPRSNVARYANHSCNPNAETHDVKHRVFIRALRNIKPGEEITYDYGRDYLKNVIGLSRCNCGRCRRRRTRRAAALRHKRERKKARLARARAVKRRSKAR
jgi:SET domain-containing protein